MIFVIKSTAHGRFLSFNGEDFCFRCFNDKNLPFVVPKDEDFLTFKDGPRDSKCLISKTAFERQKSSSLGTAHGKFLSLKHQKQKSSSLKDKNLPYALGLRNLA